MTTIICTRSAMAADRQISGGAKFRSTKIFRVGSSLIGVAGDIGYALQFVQWRMNKFPKPVFPTEVSFQAIELMPKGMLYWASDLNPVSVEEDFYAIGAGGDFALGAMSHGANLEEALKIASRWNETTGTEIQIVRLKGKQQS